jgi:hypothetical protein
VLLAAHLRVGGFQPDLGIEPKSRDSDTFG